ncbi:hypothetical protein IAD21_00364 [Abditibacteriota bacterium]|nr:hypothetical protein IAD21_00364 [Abditibacteriota bacterium]
MQKLIATLLATSVLSLLAVSVTPAQARPEKVEKPEKKEKPEKAEKPERPGHR